MTKDKAKEQAVEIFKMYYCLNNNSKSRVKVIEFETAKKCALISVNLIIERIPKFEYMEDLGKSIKNRELVFWEMIRTELENIN